MKLPCLLRLCQTKKEAQAERRHVSTEICQQSAAFTDLLTHRDPQVILHSIKGRLSSPYVFFHLVLII